MYNIGKKSSKTIIIFLFLLTLTVSCKQSCFDVITHNHVGYWSRYWTQEYPYGVIIEYSKKDGCFLIDTIGMFNSFEMIDTLRSDGINLDRFYDIVSDSEIEDY